MKHTGNTMSPRLASVGPLATDLAPIGTCKGPLFFQEGRAALLADDMGLGKTVQALALMLTRAPQGPALVLAPTSVCMNWMEEIVRFSPTLKPHFFGALSGSKNRQHCLDEAGSFDVIVCTYGLLQSEAKALADKQWQTIVADEAQAIKNPLTKRF